MSNMFGTITQPFIINTPKKKNTCVLIFVKFYDIGHKNVTRYFRLLCCVIYTIIENYVCIDYLDCQSHQLSEICIDGFFWIFKQILGG